MTAIRGAIDVVQNTEEEISNRTCQLYRELCLRNDLQERLVSALIISLTEDIDCKNPATCLREKGFLSETPLFCVQEARIKGQLPRIIRFLLLTEQKVEKRHDVYLGKAASLRPDL